MILFSLQAEKMINGAIGMRGFVTPEIQEIPGLLSLAPN